MPYCSIEDQPWKQNGKNPFSFAIQQHNLYRNWMLLIRPRGHFRISSLTSTKETMKTLFSESNHLFHCINWWQFSWRKNTRRFSSPVPNFISIKVYLQNLFGNL